MRLSKYDCKMSRRASIASMSTDFKSLANFDALSGDAFLPFILLVGMAAGCRLGLLVLRLGLCGVTEGLIGDTVFDRNACVGL